MFLFSSSLSSVKQGSHYSRAATAATNGSFVATQEQGRRIGTFPDSNASRRVEVPGMFLGTTNGPPSRNDGGGTDPPSGGDLNNFTPVTALSHESGKRAQA